MTWRVGCDSCTHSTSCIETLNKVSLLAQYSKENILKTSSGRYKLGDLGEAQLLAQVTSAIKSNSDSRYRPLELTALERGDNEALPDMKTADVFSLGVVGWELMQQCRAPREDEDGWSELRQGEATFRDGDFSAETKEMVSAMLSADPKKRPSADELVSKWLLSEQELDLM